MKIQHKATSRLVQPRKLHPELKPAPQQCAHGKADQGTLAEVRIQQPSERDAPGNGADIEETGG